MFRFLVLAATIATGARVVFACFSTPPEQIVPPAELLKRTKTIVLATVTKAELAGENEEVVYSFRTDRALKGTPPESFSIIGKPMIWQGGLETFDNHSEEVFWKPHRGRVHHGTDCVIHPGFSVGGTYLIFLDKPYHHKSFEQVIRTHGNENTRDKWLTWVEKQLAKRP